MNAVSDIDLSSLGSPTVGLSKWLSLAQDAL